MKTLLVETSQVKENVCHLPNIRASICSRHLNAPYRDVDELPEVVAK